MEDDSRPGKTFQQMADELKLPRKLLYTLDEVSRVTGVCLTVLHGECRAGRLKCHLPAGRSRGRLVRPEWVDEWIEEGTHGDGSAVA